MKLWKNMSIFILCMVASMVFAAAAAPTDVPLDSTAFPDPAFLQWSQQKDTDGDGFLSQSELDTVTSMDLRKRGIQDLTGLEHFHALQSLNCSENDLTTLTLQNFPSLTSLTCNENPKLTTLDLSGAPALQHLYCFHSNLSQLDLRDLPIQKHQIKLPGMPLQPLQQPFAGGKREKLRFTPPPLQNPLERGLKRHACIIYIIADANSQHPFPSLPSALPQGGAFLCLYVRWGYSTTTARFHQTKLDSKPAVYDKAVREPSKLDRLGAKNTPSVCPPPFCAVR